MRELYAEAEESGYQETAVVNESQDEEPLLKFLLRIGHEKRRAETPRQAAPARNAGAPSAPAVTEEQWVLDFTARLAETADDDGIAARRAEINQALAAKTIAPRTASELHREVNRHASEIRQAVAA